MPPDPGRAMRVAMEALLTLGEAATLAGALLLLPFVLAGLAFDWGLIEPLAAMVLLGAVSAAILTGVAVCQGWYSDHLCRLAGVDENSSSPSRLEPIFERPPSATMRHSPEDATAPRPPPVAATAQQRSRSTT